MSEQIEIEYKGDTLKGILLDENKDYLVIKLSSGYNANIKKSEITKEISRTKVDVKEKEVHLPQHDSKGLPKIKLIHTGGTIASKVDYASGGVSPNLSPEELKALYPELGLIADIHPVKVANFLSENMRFDHYNVMLDEIKKAISEGYDGIILSHGTDTMTYTSSALVYGCKNLPIPVIMVGAQRSSDRPSSDSFTNLKAAITFIVENKSKDQCFRSVGICMHADISSQEFNIYHGLNAKKMHSSRRDAFKQINFSPYATVSKSGKVSILREELNSELPKDNFEIAPYNTNLKISILKAHPAFNPEELEIFKNFDALIIEGTGLGHVGIENVDEFTKVHDKTLSSLKELAKKIPVVMSLQTTSGPVNMNVYSAGRKIQDAGVLGQGLTLISESLFMRVAHLLSVDKKKFNENWDSNIEGFTDKLNDMGNDF